MIRHDHCLRRNSAIVCDEAAADRALRLTCRCCASLQGWYSVLSDLNRTWGVPVFNATYFIVLIMFGSFFTLNLALAVIWGEYAKASAPKEVRGGSVPHPRTL